uniref:Uncharacterized protein n=1 Tax=Oryza rufipogon TaxID=4529 RepID=A0A0E0R4X8_ORYRU
MPPNGQDLHGGGRGGVVVLPPPPSSPATPHSPSPPPPPSKMDCFLSSVCTPLNLQFIDVAYRVKVSTTAAAAKGAPPGRISHTGAGGGVWDTVVEARVDGMLMSQSCCSN